MAVTLPAELETAFGMLRVPWPTEDEDGLRDCATAYRACAITITADVIPGAHGAVQFAAVDNAGDDIDAFTAFWADYHRDDDDSGHLSSLATTMHALADTHDGFATFVEVLKKVLVIAAGIVAAILAWAIAASAFTFGMAAVQARTAILGSRMLAQRATAVFRRELERFFGKTLVRGITTRLHGILGAKSPDRLRMRFGGRPDPLRAAANRNVNVKAITPAPVWRTDRLILRRADDRHPDEVFGPGFHPRRPDNTDLESHLRFEESAFVSTTRLSNPMDIFPTRYLYDVDAPGGVDITKTMGSALRTGHQQEVAFPGGVEGRFIKGARPYDEATKTFGDYINNPHYRP
ncbi:scabin-related ADP-ribosyltransferase [Streptosporangium sp. CA-135522]|uniref:scabin-related ADP-ribosyltransferase n=1 Tax=Streptosporangium sp. CA-135522 TaxID=3240072 RepID=UPI003D8A025C